MDGSKLHLLNRRRYLQRNDVRSQHRCVILGLLIVLSACSCTDQRTAQTMSPPEIRAQKIRDTPVQITLLTITSTRKFSDISDHFQRTELEDKTGFMYSGTDTAGIPVTEEPRTLFWVFSQEPDSPVTFFPEQAVLASGAAITHSTLMAETVHMSCPGWKFPLWQRGKEGLSGFLVFPATKGPNLELRLPYLYGQDPGILTCKFRQK